MSLVGRGAELQVLESRALAALSRSRGTTLVVQGSEGAGKSVVGAALLERLAAADAGIALARGRCRQSFGTEDPYLPFVEALRDLADDRESGSLRREEVMEMLGELAPVWLSVIPLVGTFLSAGLETAQRLRGKPAAPPSTEELFSQYLRLIGRLARQRPLVLFLDDLHLADRGSVGLLGHLARGIRDLPVVVVATLPPAAGEAAREVHELLLELERERLASRCELGELDRPALEALIAAELGAPAAPALADAIAGAAGGNPRFVVELCRLLRSEGGLRSAGGALVAADDRALSALRSADAAVARRLEQLEPEALRLLEYASVQGPEFSSALLARVMGEEELAVLDRLAELEGAGGLVAALGETTLPDGEAATRFRFASPVVHRIAYGQVVGKRRVLLHRRTAESLAEWFAADPAPVAGEIAWHFREGRLPAEAERFAALAGDTARTVDPGWAPAPLAPTPAAAPPAPESTARPAVGFVGREEELKVLAREVGLAVELSVGRTVFVQGPPGAGKSTLVAELLSRVAAARPNVTVARGRCLPTFGSADPYLPFVEALRDVSDETTLGLEEKESFGALLADIAPLWIATVPVVGNLLSATLTTATALRSRPERQAAASREAMFAQYTELLARLAQRSPLVLFLDDLHWADQSSVALLGHLARSIERLPVVVVATLRDEEAAREHPTLTALLAELRAEELARVVTLEELEGAALEQLLAAELGGDVSEPLRRWIVDTAGGNPLFACELTRLLRETGAAVEVCGEWLLTDAVRQLGVPRSAEAVIEKRIGRLDRQTLRMLQYASVAGNEFDSLLLARLLEADELSVLERLESLDRVERLVRPVGETALPGGEVATTLHFNHALVQTVLYRQVTGRRRRLLHRRAGEELERMFCGGEDQVAARLARHFHEAGADEPAYRYARGAAEHARRAYAHWEAEELFRVALEHAPDEPATVELEERLGDLYDVVAYYPRGIERYRHALELRAGAERALRLRRKITVLEGKAGLAPGPELLRRMRALLDEATADRRERCQLLLEMGRLPDSAGNLDAAAEALEIARALGDLALLGQALEQYAMGLIFTGRPADALPALAQALEHTRGDPMREARNRNLAGIAHAKLGEYPAAREAFEAMLAQVERINHYRGIGAACDCIGRLMIRLGELEAAEPLLQRARVAHERRDRPAIVHSLFNLAERAMLAGELDLAVERWTQLASEAEALGHATFVAAAHGGAGLCMLRQDDLSGARAAAEAATRAIGERTDWFENRETVELLLARLDRAAGLPEAAERRLAAAAAALETGDLYLWAWVQLERVQLLDPGAGRTLLERVRSMAGRIESPPLRRAIAAARPATAAPARAAAVL